MAFAAGSPAAVARRRVRRVAAAAAAASVPVPGLGRHVGGARRRHAQPGDDRRTRGPCPAGRDGGGTAAAAGAGKGAGRVPIGYASFGAGLASGALSVDRHDAAVRRPGDHAVRVAAAVGLSLGAHVALGRAVRSGGRLPADRRRAAHGADGGTGARDRHRAGAVTTAGGDGDVPDAAGRRAGERAGVRRPARAVQRDASDPGGAGRGGGDGAAQRRRTVEAGIARAGLAGAGTVRHGVARLAGRAAGLAKAGRGGGGDGRLQPAGRAARTVWRAGARPAGRCDDGPDGPAGGGWLDRVRRRRMAARTRARPLPAGGDGRAGGAGRLHVRDAGRTLALEPDLRIRNRADRVRRRAVPGRDVVGCDGSKRPSFGRAGARAVGRGAGVRRRRRHRRRRDRP